MMHEECTQWRIYIGQFSKFLVILQEVLVLLLASVRSTWGVVQREVCSSLTPIFLLGHTNGIAVLHALWEVNKEEVVKAMVDLYVKDAAHIPRILDVCQVYQLTEYVVYSAALPCWCIILAKVSDAEFCQHHFTTVYADFLIISMLQ